MLAFARTCPYRPSASLEEGQVAWPWSRQENEETGYDKVVRDDSGNVLGILFGREAGPDRDAASSKVMDGGISGRGRVVEEVALKWAG